MKKLLGIAMLASLGFVVTTDASAFYKRLSGGDCLPGDIEVGPPGHLLGCCNFTEVCPIAPTGDVLLSELQHSLTKVQEVDILTEEQKVDTDMAFLFERLANSDFRAELAQTCHLQDVRAATILLQSTASMTTVDVEMDPNGPNRGRYCWQSNGIRKCLWYTEC